MWDYILGVSIGTAIGIPLCELFEWYMGVSKWQKW